MVKTIYITRHGYRSNWVLDKPMPDPPTGIPADPVLAEHGLDQAQELGAYISSFKDCPVQQIYCSPYYRCIQTASPTSKSLETKLFIEHGASEWLSRPSYDQSPLPASTHDLAHKYFSTDIIDESYEPVIPHSTVGESYQQLLARAKTFISQLIARLDKEAPHIENILIVTHAATKIALGRALLQDDTYDIRTGTCSLDTYVRGDTPSEWIAKSIGETSFLTNGEEMHWSFDIAYAPGSTEDIAARLQGSDSQVLDKEEPEAEPEEMATVYVTLDLSQVQQNFFGDFASFYTKKKNNDDGLNYEHGQENNGEDLDSDDEDDEDYEDSEDDDDDEDSQDESKNLLDEKLRKRAGVKINSFSGTKSTLRTKHLSQIEEKNAQAFSGGDYSRRFQSSTQRMRVNRASRMAAAAAALSKNSALQIVDLASDHPLFRVGNDLYMGVWEDLVGTELYTNFEGEVVGKTRTRIRLVPAKVKSRALHTVMEESQESALYSQPLNDSNNTTSQAAETSAGPPTTPRKSTNAQHAEDGGDGNTQGIKTPKNNASNAATTLKSAKNNKLISGPGASSTGTGEVRVSQTRLLDRLKEINLRRIAAEGPPEPTERRKKELEAERRKREANEEVEAENESMAKVDGDVEMKDINSGGDEGATKPPSKKGSEKVSEEPEKSSEEVSEKKTGDLTEKTVEKSPQQESSKESEKGL